MSEFIGITHCVMSGDELFKKLAKGKAQERKSVTIYLSRPLFDEFKEICESKEVSASRAIEQLVRDLIESQKPAALSAVPAPSSSDPRITKIVDVLTKNPLAIEQVLAAIDGIETTFYQSKGDNRSS